MLRAWTEAESHLSRLRLRRLPVHSPQSHGGAAADHLGQQSSRGDAASERLAGPEVTAGGPQQQGRLARARLGRGAALEKNKTNQENDPEQGRAGKAPSRSCWGTAASSLSVPSPCHRPSTATFLVTRAKSPPGPAGGRVPPVVADTAGCPPDARDPFSRLLIGPPVLL